MFTFHEINSAWQKAASLMKMPGLLLLCISNGQISQNFTIYCCEKTNPSVTQKPVTNFVNSLRPSDAIWQYRSESTLTQVMACCLTAPSHYLNQCWLIISEVQRHSPERTFMGNVPTINRYNGLENQLTKTLLKSPRGQMTITKYV